MSSHFLLNKKYFNFPSGVFMVRLIFFVGALLISGCSAVQTRCWDFGPDGPKICRAPGPVIAEKCKSPISDTGMPKRGTWGGCADNGTLWVNWDNPGGVIHEL